MSNELPADQNPHENHALSVSQRLEQLAQRANEAHLKVGAALKNGLAYAYEVGGALLEAFEICPKRRWHAWLAANFKPSRWTARRYMDFATECNQRFGGLSGATLHQIPPEEAGSVLKKLSVRPSGRKKPHARQTLPASPATSPRADAPAPPAAQPAATVKLPAETANPYLPLKKLLEDLMERLRVIMESEDCHDGPFAELLLMDVKSVYADLVEHLEDRDRLRRSA